LDVIVRRLVVADAQALRHLRLEALQVAPEAFNSSYEEEAARPFEWFESVATGPDRNAMFGVFHDGALVGMAGFVAGERLKEHHKGTLVGVYVQPPFRRRRLARRLVEAVIAHAAQHVRVLNATVGVGNPSARALYRDLGFATYGTEPQALCLDDRFIANDLIRLDLASRSS
jgi:ribosomal protein S18 acetylase RimI-like enzyme